MLNIEHGDKIYIVVNIYCPTNQQERILFCMNLSSGFQNIKITIAT